MDTVCAPRFTQQEQGPEIILSTPLVTDVFPAVNRDGAHFRQRRTLPGATAQPVVKGAGDAPTGG
ncbi:hypothetical protein Srubr_06240 [Streptomyces rubradiris]|uniref:Uncharacterized protein n=1 Tax=Streptomyces rubradiris TaxID=285531 RepID=A0ABQ3R4I8_STRRR|nr:hypothetical protein GCM10018792_25300 [Streptomyces rubradiris]GHI50778.1 hypothetical protein Srubr_06240 [Streptomyces rubradiris]